MKQATFLKITIATNICFLFLIVQKSSKSIQLSYDRQKILKEKEELTHRQTELTHQLYANKSLTKVKQFASNELGMKPCTMKQVKHLALENHTDTNAQSEALNQQKPLLSETKKLTQNNPGANPTVINQTNPGALNPAGVS